MDSLICVIYTTPLGNHMNQLLIYIYSYDGCIEMNIVLKCDNVIITIGRTKRVNGIKRLPTTILAFLIPNRYFFKTTLLIIHSLCKPNCDMRKASLANNVIFQSIDLCWQNEKKHFAILLPLSSLKIA